ESSSMADIDEPLPGDGLVNQRRPPQRPAQMWMTFYQVENSRLGQNRRFHRTQRCDGVIYSLQQQGPQIADITWHEVSEYLAPPIRQNPVTAGHALENDLDSLGGCRWPDQVFVCHVPANRTPRIHPGGLLLRGEGREYLQLANQS